MIDDYCLPDEVIKRMFVAIEGELIGFPERFSPVSEYVEFHRNQVFRSA